MGKSIFTMSAAQRLKAQERQSRRFDRAVNKKFKAMKKAWKKKIAGTYKERGFPERDGIKGQSEV